MTPKTISGASGKGVTATARYALSTVESSSAQRQSSNVKTSSIILAPPLLYRLAMAGMPGIDCRMGQ